MKTLFTISVVIILAVVIVVWSGIYNVAANDDHFAVTTTLLELVRERSIKVRSKDIDVPDLEDIKLISAGEKDYIDMCTACHLAPGVSATELHNGLNPSPPIFHEITQNNTEPAEMFWVIKNGIKMTGMPAWAPSHSEQEIWGMVAYIKKLNGMSIEEFESFNSVTTNEKTGHDGPGHSH